MEASDKPGPSVDESDDLNSLLDSALGDFGKALPKIITETTPVASASKAAPNLSKAESAEWDTKEFKQVHEAMQSLLKDDPHFKAEFARFAGGDASNFSASLEEAMKAIAQDVQSSPEPTPEEITKLFNGLGLPNGPTAFPPGDQLPDFMPFMQNIMQNLLSKEVLYPALKDIVSKYPEWLADNRMTLETSIYQNYSKQYDLMKQICEEFEMSHEPSEDAQTRQFEKILALMQKMQECGNPPKELMGDLPPSLPFDEEGNMKLTGGVSEQCNIM